MSKDFWLKVLLGLSLAANLVAVPCVALVGGTLWDFFVEH